MITFFKDSESLFWNFISVVCFLCLSVPAIVAADLIPDEHVQSFLKDYSQTETELIKDDLDNLRKLCFRDITAAAQGQKTYVATAGGPGASKSTILETYLHDKPNFAYLDPDTRAIKLMINTYLQELTNYKISKASNLTTLLQKAYDKWRGGSNYIATTLVNEAYGKGFNIAHGTTSTGEHIGKLYEGLKQKGYNIVLLLCNSTDKNRVEALEYRVKTQFFCQVAPEDIIKKGAAFFERFPIYFQYADELQLYWTGDFSKDARLAATLTRGKKITIHDAEALKNFTAQYDQERKDKKLEPLQELIKGFESKN